MVSTYQARSLQSPVRRYVDQSGTIVKVTQIMANPQQNIKGPHSMENMQRMQKPSDVVVNRFTPRRLFTKVDTNKLPTPILIQSGRTKPTPKCATRSTEVAEEAPAPQLQDNRNVLDIAASRSTQSKKELERLKAELELLLHSNTRKPETSDAPPQCDCLTDTEEMLVKEDSCTTVQEKQLSPESPPKQPPRSSLKRKKRRPIQEPPKIETPKKVRHYDPKTAREWIKKQKLLRQNKLQEEIKFKKALQEEKRRKLRELQDKTMKMIYQTKPKRSKKFVEINGDVEEDKINIDEITQTLSTPEKIPQSKRSEEMSIHIQEEIPKCHIKSEQIVCTPKCPTQFEQIVCTVSSLHDDLMVPDCHLVTKISPRWEYRNRAATKIQAAFKGYQQRKIFKTQLKLHRIYKPKILRDNICKDSETPSWLQPASLPYPYNFISAVKQKLNLAIYGYPSIPSEQSLDDTLSDSETERHHISRLQVPQNPQTPILKSTITSNRSTQSTSHIDKTSRNSAPKNYTSISSKSPTNKLLSLSEELKTDINSFYSGVSDLRLDLRGVNSYSTHSSRHTRKSLTNDEIRDILSKSIQSMRNREYLSDTSPASKDTIGDRAGTQPNASPITSPNSTGHDIESAILSFSDRYAVESGQAKPSQHSSRTNRNSPPLRRNSHRQKISSNIVKTSYENTFTTTSQTVQEELYHREPSPKDTVSTTSSSRLTAAQSLHRPTDTLKVGNLVRRTSETKYVERKIEVSYTSDAKSVSPQPRITSSNVKADAERKPHEIHLKFEAELRLMDSFRDSLHKMAAENAALTHKCRINENVVNKLTQTSLPLCDNQLNKLLSSSLNVVSKRSEADTTEQNTSNRISSIQSEQISPPVSHSTNSQSTAQSALHQALILGRLHTVNYKRGSDTGQPLPVDHSKMPGKGPAFVSSSLELSKMAASFKTNSETPQDQSVGTNSSVNGHIQGFSIEMIDQQIRNEDIQLDRFKTLLKIREKSLIDRTKGELAWLELTKKQLREQGNIGQASAVKKKQRGLILKLQQEKHEMQRLKQMHKASCEERKVMLKEQKSIIKKQLSTNKMLTQFKRPRGVESKQMGPMKVYDMHNRSDSIVTSYDEQSHSDRKKQSISISEAVSIRTTSIKNSSEADVSSEVESHGYSKSITVQTNSQVSDAEKLKLSLAKREEELKKRRQTAEELLRWHRRLSDEEKRVAALEEEARKVTLEQEEIIYTMMGSQLNNLWFNITGNMEQKYQTKNTYHMTRRDLDRFYDEAKKEVLENIKPENCNNAYILASSRNQQKCSVDLENSRQKSLQRSVPSQVESIDEMYSESQSVTQNGKSPSAHSVTVVEELPRSSNSSPCINSKRTEHELLKQDSPAIEDEISNAFIETVSVATSNNEVLASHTSDEPLKGGTISDTIKSFDHSKTPLSNRGETSSIIESDLSPTSKSEKNMYRRLSIPQDRIAQSLKGDTSVSSSALNNSQDTFSEASKSSDLKIVQEINTNTNGKITPSESPIVSSKTPHECHSQSEQSEAVKSEVLSVESIVISDSEHTTGSIEGNSACEISAESILETRCASANSSEVISSKHTSPISDRSNREDSDNRPDAKTDTDTSPRSLNLSHGTCTSQLSPVHSEPLEEDADIKPSEETSVSELQIANSDTAYVDSETRSESSVNSCDLSDPKSSVDVSSMSAQTESSSRFKLISATDLNMKLLEENIRTANTPSEIIDQYDEVITSRSDCELNETPHEPIASDGISRGSKSNSAETAVSDGISISDSTTSEVLTNKPNTDSNLSVSDKSDESAGSEEEGNIDVLKRVHEILAETSPRQRTPRVQDLWVTTYDVVPMSPEKSPESESPIRDIPDLTSDSKRLIVHEAEELLRKQLEIEQEIKELEKQQRSEVVPYVYVREIPNKPPPPYTPPVSAPIPKVDTYVPPTDVEQVKLLLHAAADFLFAAYEANQLTEAEPTYLPVTDNEVESNYNRFIFDLCKEIANEVLILPSTTLFVPSWMKTYTDRFAPPKPKTKAEFVATVESRVTEYLGMGMNASTEKLICSWSAKKRDHVDNLLVKESQAEEALWTRYDEEEVIVKNELTNEIFDILLTETAAIIRKTLAKKCNKTNK